MSVEATDLVILEKAIKAVASAKKALIKEIAAGAGKARFHAQTFTQVSTALDQLESMRVGKARATKPKATKDEVV